VIVDAHVHVWDPAAASYDWLGPGMGDLDRAVSFDEIDQTLASLGIDGVVLVQAADDARDTDLMLAVAARTPRILGVVAWSPLDEPARLAADLERFAVDPLVVGVRNLLHERPASWLDRPEVIAGLGVLERAGLPLDFPTTGPAALSSLAEIAARHPGLPVVIDHLGKPPIGGDRAARVAWRELLAECARHPLVVAKLSGLYSSVGALASWSVDAVRPFVEDALELFGPGRLLYGGDWPISELAGGYARTWSAMTELLAPLTAVDRDAVLGGTAARVYGLRSLLG
jgi:L-fuconolactonase